MNILNLILFIIGSIGILFMLVIMGIYIFNGDVNEDYEDYDDE